MANFADTAAGRVAAEDLVKTRVAAGTWIQGHMAVNESGNTIVRYQKPASASARDNGGWVTSRADDAS